MKPKGILKNSTREVTVLYGSTRSAVKIVARETDIPGLVVHRRLDAVGQPILESWTITHEASGLAAGFGISSIQIVRRALERIAELNIDWTQQNEKVATNANAARVRAVLLSVEARKQP